MSGPAKWSLVADARPFLAEMKQVGASLDDVADAVETMADTTGAAADQAGDGIERAFAQAARGADRSLEQVAKGADADAEKIETSFRTSLKSVSKSAKTAGDDVGRHLKDGAKEAGDGVDELKEESAQSAREMAASFDGSLESFADMAQEVAAQAFKGFGPAGAAAGLAAALGIGLGLKGLEEYEERIKEAKDEAIDLAKALAEAGGNPDAIDWAARLTDALTKVVDDKKFYEFWQDKPVTAMQQWSGAAKQLGADWKTIAAGMSGDSRHLGAAQDELARAAAGVDRQYLRLISEGLDPSVASMISGKDAADTLTSALKDQAGKTSDAAEMADLLTSAQDEAAAAAKHSAEVHDAYKDAIVASLGEAGKSWDKYVEDGKVNLDAYNAAVEAQIATVQAYETNMAAASQILSAEALDYLKSLGPKAAPLLQAFVDAPLAKQQQIGANWQILGTAASDGYESQLDLDARTRAAVDTANRTRHTVRIAAEFDATDLDAQIRRAARSITPPTINLPLRPGVQYP